MFCMTHHYILDWCDVIKHNVASSALATVQIPIRMKNLSRFHIDDCKIFVRKKNVNAKTVKSKKCSISYLFYTHLLLMYHLQMTMYYHQTQFMQEVKSKCLVVVHGKWLPNSAPARFCIVWHLMPHLANTFQELPETYKLWEFKVEHYLNLLANTGGKVS